jgi:sec-independent protein translocase protein TatB
MFDVSFSELLVIAVVALLVIGPEKLPKVARTVGAFTGRMQRYMAQIKEEVNREMRFDELQKLQQEIKQSVENAQENIQQQADEMKSAVSDTAKPKKAISKPATSKTTRSPKPKTATVKRVKVATK